MREHYSASACLVYIIRTLSSSHRWFYRYNDSFQVWLEGFTTTTVLWAVMADSSPIKWERIFWLWIPLYLDCFIEKWRYNLLLLPFRPIRLGMYAVIIVSPWYSVLAWLSSWHSASTESPRTRYQEQNIKEFYTEASMQYLSWYRAYSAGLK